MRTLIAALALTALALPVAAQNVNADPAYGTLSLGAYFMPDPNLRNVQAGGSIDVSGRIEGCRGYIASSPDLRLNLSGDSTLPLIVSVNSNADTTLVINGPRGEWYCDDDSGEGLNPSIRLNSRSGRYEIWVGVYSSGQLRNATLSISELESF